MKNTIVPILVMLSLASSLSLYSQGIKQMAQENIGVIFPTLTAETLSGEEITYPDDIKNRVSLITMAFKRKTQRILDSWTEPFLKEFENDSTVQFYEIPMLPKALKVMSSMIDGGMRSGIPVKKHGNVSTYYGKVNEYCKLLSMEDKSDGYLFLLDRNGVIRWRANGFATPEKLKELIEKVESLKID